MTSAPPRIARAAAALGLTLSCLTASVATASPARATLSIATAKARAAREGKLVFVRFTAAWCVSCRLLEETTLAEPRVRAYLGEHYVHAAIDVDDFDGSALKQHYGVGTLPTLLFLSSEGREVGRIGEGVGATELLRRLGEYDTPDNRRVIASAARVGASEAGVDDPSQRSKAHATGLQGPPPEHAGFMGYVSPAQAPAPALAAGPTAPRGAGEGSLPAPAQSFSLRAGVYAHRPDAVRAAERLRDDSGEAVLLEFGYAAGRPVYRLYVGRFADLVESEALRRRLGRSGYELSGRAHLTW